MSARARLLYHTAALVLLLALTSVDLHAAESAKADEPPEHDLHHPIVADASLWKTHHWMIPGAFLDPNATGVDAQLGMFCETGYLQDRCLQSAFTGPAEMYIIRQLAKSEAFCQELGLTDEQLEKLAAMRKEDLVDVPVPFTLKSRLEREALTSLEQSFWPFRAHLDAPLTLEQRQKLPVIFLRLEGLTAIRRLEFQGLIGLSLDEQRRIVDLFDACTDNVYGPIGRALFSDSQHHDLYEPSLIAQRRAAGVALDYQILSLLSPEQRKKLAPLTEAARQKPPLIDSAGAFKPR